MEEKKGSLWLGLLIIALGLAIGAGLTFLLYHHPDPAPRGVFSL